MHLLLLSSSTTVSLVNRQSRTCKMQQQLSNLLWMFNACTVATLFKPDNLAPLDVVLIVLGILWVHKFVIATP